MSKKRNVTKPKDKAKNPQAASPQAASPQANEPQANEAQANEAQANEAQANEAQAASPQANEPQAASPQAASPQAASPRDTAEALAMACAAHVLFMRSGESALTGDDEKLAALLSQYLGKWPEAKAETLFIHARMNGLSVDAEWRELAVAERLFFEIFLAVWLLVTAAEEKDS